MVPFETVIHVPKMTSDPRDSKIFGMFVVDSSFNLSHVINRTDPISQHCDSVDVYVEYRDIGFLLYQKVV